MQLLQKKEEKERGESHYTKRLNKSKSNKSYKFKVVAYTTEHLPLPSSRYAALPQPLGVRGFSLEEGFGGPFLLQEGYSTAGKGTSFSLPGKSTMVLLGGFHPSHLRNVWDSHKVSDVFLHLAPSPQMCSSVQWLCLLCGQCLLCVTDCSLFSSSPLNPLLPFPGLHPWHLHSAGVSPVTLFSLAAVRPVLQCHCRVRNVKFCPH